MLLYWPNTLSHSTILILVLAVRALPAGCLLSYHITRIHSVALLFYPLGYSTNLILVLAVRALPAGCLLSEDTTLLHWVAFLIYPLVYSTNLILVQFAHFPRYASWVILLIESTLLLYWFNPLGNSMKLIVIFAVRTLPAVCLLSYCTNLMHWVILLI